MYIERLFNVLSLQIKRRFNKDYLIFIKYGSLYKEERLKKESNPDEQAQIAEQIRKLKLGE